MEKKIEFDADVRADGMLGQHIICHKDVPGGEEWNRVHVTLTPVSGPEPSEREAPELDYREMYYELMGVTFGISFNIKQTIDRHCKLIEKARQATDPASGKPANKTVGKPSGEEGK